MRFKTCCWLDPHGEEFLVSVQDRCQHSIVRNLGRHCYSSLESHQLLGTQCADNTSLLNWLADLSSLSETSSQLVDPGPLNELLCHGIIYFISFFAQYLKKKKAS